MQFAKELRRLRKAAGLTQESLAVKAGISAGLVRNYEQDKGLPSFPTVVKLAAALGVTCEAFAGCDDVADGQAEAKPATPAKGKRKA